MARGSPGPQNPSKYPKTGPNYKRWGELTQQGYTYNPETDTYVADPAGAKKQLQDEGLVEKPPEEPSLTDQLLPIGATALAIKGGGAIGEALTSGETLSMLGDLFSGGGGESMMLDSITSAAPGAESALASAGSYILPAAAIAIAANRGYEAFNRGRDESNPLKAFTGEFKNPFDAKNIIKSPLLFPLNPMLAVGGSLMSSAGMGGKSTKDYQEQRLGQLLDNGFTDEQMKVLRPGLYGEETNDDEWKRLMSIPGNKELYENSVTANWGSDGLLKTFGPEYLNNMSEQDRWAVTRYAIDNGFLRDDKGDRVISGGDQERLKAAAEEAKKNPAYIEEYNRWVALGKPKDGLNPLITDPTEAQQILETKEDSSVPDPNAGLLVPDINVANSGVKGPAIQDPTKQGLLV